MRIGYVIVWAIAAFATIVESCIAFSNYNYVRKLSEGTSAIEVSIVDRNTKASRSNLSERYLVRELNDETRSTTWTQWYLTDEIGGSHYIGEILLARVLPGSPHGIEVGVEKRLKYWKSASLSFFTAFILCFSAGCCMWYWPRIRKWFPVRQSRQYDYNNKEID